MGIDEKIIQNLMRSLTSSKAISFNQTISDSQRVLFTPSYKKDITLTYQFISRFREQFPGRRTYLLRYETQASQSIAEEIEELTIGRADQNLWKLWRNPQVEALKKKRLDIIIDLDPEFNLLHAFLCRRLNAPLRITFAKPKSHLYYNIEFSGTTSTDYAKQLSGLLQFLNQFRS